MRLKTSLKACFYYQIYFKLNFYNTTGFSCFYKENHRWPGSTYTDNDSINAIILNLINT